MTGVESRQFVGLITDYGHTLGLEVLECEAEVKDRLGSGTDNHDRCLRQFIEVGRYIKSLLCMTMHAADTSGSEDLDSSHSGNDHRGGDGGRSIFFTCDKYRQVTTRSLDDCRSFLS